MIPRATSPPNRKTQLSRRAKWPPARRSGVLFFPEPAHIAPANSPAFRPGAGNRACADASRLPVGHWRRQPSPPTRRSAPASASGPFACGGNSSGAHCATVSYLLTYPLRQRPHNVRRPFAHGPDIIRCDHRPQQASQHCSETAAGSGAPSSAYFAGEQHALARRDRSACMAVSSLSQSRVCRRIREAPVCGGMTMR